MDITLEQFARATEAPMLRAQRWHMPITNAMAAYDVNRPERAAMFLAQVSHESGRFLYSRELWGPTPAQTHYEGRADLGNLRPGDGRRYLGRGPIQVTGRSNYAAARDRLNRLFPNVPDFEASPEMLEDPAWGARAAAEFWCRNGLNEIADAGDILLATRKINGGQNGLDDRMALWETAKAVLGV